MMDTILGGIAFAGLIAAQFLAVIAVHRERLGEESRSLSMELYRELRQPDILQRSHSDRSNVRQLPTDDNSLTQPRKGGTVRKAA